MTAWQRLVRFAEPMFAMATWCCTPAVSVVRPAYCENPVPSSCDALIWNWLPETANETGTAPLATPVIMRVAATATGTAASAIRPPCEPVSVENFIGSSLITLHVTSY